MSSVVLLLFVLYTTANRCFSSKDWNRFSIITNLRERVITVIRSTRVNDIDNKPWNTRRRLRYARCHHSSVLKT